MPDITFFTLVRGICAASFAATALLVVLQLAPRFLARMKHRILQLAFAFGLTTVIAVALARADAAPGRPRYPDHGLTLQDRVAATQAQQVFSDAGLKAAVTP